MGKEGRIYAVVAMKTGMTKSAFDYVKFLGVIESWDTLRYSLDGTKAIMKWRKNPTSISNALGPWVLWSGDHKAMLQYLETNAKDWTKDDIMQPSFISRVSRAIIAPVGKTVSTAKKVPWWLWLVIISGAAGVALIFI